MAVQAQGLGLAPEPSRARSVLIWWQQGKGSLQVTLEIWGGATVNPGCPVPNPGSSVHSTITGSYFSASCYAGAVLSVSPL